MKKTGLFFRRRSQSGQALVEYALILVMVAILFGVTLAATGPAIGNVFSNVIYNIIGGRPEDVERLAAEDGRGRDEAFWATVAWLATNPPEEQSFGLNNPLPPPDTATPGPSPTPTDITPTVTPSNTPTATATRTPADEGIIAPYLDTIDNPEYWRVNTNTWVGSDQFYGEYFANNNLNGDPEETLWHQEILGDDPRSVNWGSIDFNWPSGSSPIEGGFTNTNYSVRWTRQIGYGFGTGPAQAPKKILFSLTTGGGQSGGRVWLYEVGSTTPLGGCSSVSSGGTFNGTGQGYSDGDSPPSGSASNCLVIDGWRDNEETITAERTIQPNRLYIVQVDFYKKNGDGRVKLDMTSLSAGNPDDASLISGNAPQCSWYRANTQRSNSNAFIWEEAQAGEFPQNQICYLELRGWVEYSLVSNPKLIFWDVWDMSNANTKVWLEVAEYKPNRADLNWQQIPLRQGTTNYAWTRNIIDLAPYIAGFSQKRLTLRFAMQDENGGARRRWYVDDIEVRNFTTKTYDVCINSKTTCDSYWDMDNASFTLGDASRNISPQFVTSGRWSLTTTNAQGQYSLGNSPAIRVNEDGGGNRVHFVEFNGLIDVTSNLPDFDGDDGVAVLSFHHAYEVANGTQLEIQWTRDTPDKEPDNWQTLEVLVPDPVNTGTKVQVLEEATVLLDGIPGWDTSAFRLRFAQIVKPNAVQSGGWWIDNVLLHRFDKPRFTDYPFFDDAQDGTGNWLTQGQWGITDQTNYTLGLFEGSGRAFADSPGGNYLAGNNTALILRHPLDLNYDTPENLAADDDSNNQTAAATRPILSFWHWRNLNSSHDFYVDWSNNDGQDWYSIWRFDSGVVNSTYLDNGHVQRAWEYVEIDLRDIQANIATNGATPYDDDIILRFRLDTRGGSGTRDGVFLDDIRIADYAETSHKLWDTNHPTHGTGNGIRYTDDFDSPSDYWNRWKLGSFVGVDNTQHSGLIALHESPARSNGNSVRTPGNTYNVLTMNRIIDLRGISGANNPTLYFWTRYYIGQDDTLQVQIASENTSYRPTNGSGVHNTFDYERVAGWNDWENRWQISEYGHVDTWYRAAVDLKPYAGQRIKVRFVYDALRSGNEDGWYIDDVIFEQRSTTPIPLPLTDNAKNLSNWLVEGTWGLAPDQWRGTGGGPADIGNDFWTGVYYDCERHRSNNRCNNLNDFNNLLYTDYANKIKRPYDPSLDIQEFALEIDHDFGGSGRPNGGLLDATWLDYYAARWERPITITAPSDVTFITVSDDGVRLKYSGPGAPNPNGWNIIEVWSYHGRRVDVGTVSFNPGNYNLTLEWFEASGDAVIILSAGVNNFSFGDSPRAGNGPSFPQVNSVPYGNSSLILKSPIDLTGATLPVIEYYTRYRMGGGTGRVQVSTNGGFSWVQNNLGSNNNGFVCPPSTSCSPTITGNYGSWGDPTQWQRRQHNLTSYRATGLINLRFNLVTADSVDDGWYVTDIRINP